jgi:hypothetical protein
MAFLESYAANYLDARTCTVHTAALDKDDQTRESKNALWYKRLGYTEFVVSAGLFPRSDLP